MFFLALFLTSCNTNNIVIVQEQNEKVISEVPIINPTYTFNLNIDPKEKKISGTQKIKYVNNTGIPLNKIFFNIPINAFGADSNFQPYFDSEKDLIYTKESSEGGHLTVFNIMVNQESLKFIQKGSVLEVDFISTIDANETVDIILELEGTIPSIKHRSGSNENVIWINNFLPTIAVFDKYGWHTDTYYPVGDPYFTDIANYNVTITTPSEYSVVSTDLEVSTISDNINTTVINTKLVRDFSFAIIKDFKVHTFLTKEDVAVNFYTYSDLDNTKEKKIDQLLITTEKSIDKLNQLLGTYPYHSLDFIETDTFFKEGVIGSQIVFFDSDALFGNNNSYLITNAISHQWFYGIIGNNQIRDAWLDEGFSLFFTDYIMLDKNDFDSKLKEEYYLLQKNILLYKNKLLSVDLSVYDDKENYYAIQCIKSKLMIYSLFNKLGEQQFLDFVKLYQTNFSFSIVYKEDFISTAEQIYGDSLAEFFDSWMNFFEMPKL